MDFQKKYENSFSKQQRAWLESHYAGETFSDDDQTALAQMAKLLMDDGQYYTKDDPLKLAKIAKWGTEEPSLEDYATTAGFSGKDAVQNFADAYVDPKKGKAERDTWAALIQDRYGEAGYDKAQQLIKQKRVDDMNKKIQKERKAIMEGYDPETGEVVPSDMAQSIFMGLFQPRQKQAYIEGRDPTSAEIAMDAVSNAAYATPVSGIEKAIATRAGGNLLGRIAGATTANAVVPTGVAIGDYMLGGKQYAGPKDAAVDIGLGTLTNLGVNKGAAAVGGRLLSGLQGKTKSDRGAVTSVRKMLEGAPTPKEEAQAIVDNATNEAKEVLKAKGSYEPEQLKKNLILAEFGRIIKNKDTASELAKNVKEANSMVGERNTDAYMLIGKEPLWQIDLQTPLNYRPSPDRVLETKVRGRDISSTMHDFPPEPDDNLWSFINHVPDDNYIIRESLRMHPELEELLIRDKKKEVVKAALLAAKNFGVNKYGTDSDASNLLMAIPGGDLIGIDKVTELRKKQQKWRDAVKKQLEGSNK